MGQVDRAVGGDLKSCGQVAATSPSIPPFMVRSTGRAGSFAQTVGGRVGSEDRYCRVSRPCHCLACFLIPKVSVVH